MIDVVDGSMGEDTNVNANIMCDVIVFLSLQI